MDEEDAALSGATDAEASGDVLDVTVAGGEVLKVPVSVEHACE